MKTKWNMLMLFALLLGLVVISPKPTASAAVGAATFYFTSSANPSRQYAAVTFTVSATGTDPTYPPFGTVSFFDNGEAILCQGEVYYYQAKLNMNENFNPVDDVPAVCRTSALSPGLHVITAVFNSHWTPAYEDASLTLADGQTVNPPLPLTIGPDTLPDGVYDIWYEQSLTAVANDGYSCGSDCWWSLVGSIPEGLYINGSTLKIEGTPEQSGDFAFTITAKDTTAGYEGSRSYTLTISEVTPVINIFSIAFTPNDELYLQAIVNHPDSPYTYPSGAVSFSIDGVPFEACSGANAIPVGTWGFATCIAPPPPGLALGDYPLLVEFISGEPGYNNASVGGTLTMLGRIEGRLFEDLDLDGIWDSDTETPVPSSWTVNLDRNCDGSVNHSSFSDSFTGQFSIKYLLPDLYCLSVPAPVNWRQTTSLGQITLNANQYFEIGFSFIQLAHSPETLPDGSTGEAYNQSILISGGEPPYTITYADVNLPAGLTFDQSTFTISGTPTSAGYGWLNVLFQDAGGATGDFQYDFLIQTEGSFTLISDANPSPSGQAVTFTLTGSGDVLDANMTPIAPPGSVTFYDGDTAIEGCVDVPLNLDPELGFVDQPAVCTTSALSVGSHEISAVFSSAGLYLDATRTLTQQIGPLDTTFSVFLPIILG